MSENINRVENIDDDEQYRADDVWQFVVDFSNQNLNKMDRNIEEIKENHKVVGNMAKKLLVRVQKVRSIDILLDFGINSGLRTFFDEYEKEHDMRFELPEEIPPSRLARVRVIVKNDGDYVSDYFREIRNIMSEVQDRLENEENEVYENRR